MENAVNEIPLVEEEPITVGEQLKTARERIGMTLSDLAAETRVPMRHLESIERSEFGALPGHTYTVGFVRSYARAVALDDNAVVNALRLELSSGGHERYEAPSQNYEPADPARVPSKTLAWTAAGVAALVLAAYLIFRSYAFAPALAPHTATSTPITSQKAISAPSVTTVKDDEAVANVGISGQAPSDNTNVVAAPEPASSVVTP